MNAADEAERIRLLYVATTRAADYLVLSGGLSAKDFEAPTAPWIKLLKDRFDLETGRLVAALPKQEGYHSPAVKVTTELPPIDAPVRASHHLNLEIAITRAVTLADELKTQSAPSTASLSAIRNEVYQLARPVPVDLSAQRRFSVSRLSGQLQAIVEQPSSSLLFAEDEQANDLIMPTVGGADLGTLVHQTLARIDFVAVAKANDSSRQESIRAIVKRCAQSSAAAELFEPAADLIIQFLQSPRARQLADAKKIHRELEFLLAWPPGENAKDGRYLQGFIDCLYQDAAGGWHLLDYKTNQVSASGAASLAAQFELQLGVYALAVEQILRQPPAELAVHFLRPTIDHRFKWDSAIRQRTIDCVNQAIEMAVMQHISCGLYREVGIVQRVRFSANHVQTRSAEAA